MTISVRLSLFEEEPYLIEWLSDPDSLKGFPITGLKEIEDTVRIWLGHTRLKSAFTAFFQDTVAGMAVLYVQPYQKTAHQALFAIIVDKKYHNKGIGGALLTHLTNAAREQFNIEILHLEVYAENPAIRLYERHGFKYYGKHPRFIKLEDGTYLDKILMEKQLSPSSS